MHHLKHNKALHERVVLLSIAAADTPDVSDAERVTVTAYPHGFYRVTAVFGFMEQPSVPQVLRLCERQGLSVPLRAASFYLGRERIIPTGREKLSRWRKQLFIVMSRNAQSATEYFQIPPNRVVELGAQIEF
jgi:KUP system potassium uptake protein